MSASATCEACRAALDAVRSYILDERELCRPCFDEQVSKLPFSLRFAASVKTIDSLDDDDPLWCVNEQIKGLLQGEGATEDHDAVLEFLSKTGLPDGTVKRMHQALVCGDSKVLPDAEEVRNSKDELALLRKIAEMSSDLIKGRGWKEFATASGGIEELERAHAVAVEAYESYQGDFDNGQ